MSNEEFTEIQESVQRLREKSRSLADRVAEHERTLRQVLDQRTNVEMRLTMLETERARFGDEVSEIDRRLRIFELGHDNRKENWRMVVNFVVQLAWVAMAAFMLSKLGLQAPL